MRARINASDNRNESEFERISIMVPRALVCALWIAVNTVSCIQYIVQKSWNTIAIYIVYLETWNNEFCKLQAVVSGNYIFVLQLISFDDPSNTLANGSCCVCCETDSSCSSPCDIGLRVCLRPAGYDRSDSSCPLLELYGDDRPRIANWAVSGAWPVRSVA